ncbi:MAG TPA: hypothetical protein VJA21_08100 [Verrucomicrobiae bacterium]
MKSFIVYIAVAGLFSASVARAAGPGIALSSPGFLQSQLDGEGRLVEDWGPIQITLQGDGLTPGASAKVKALKLDGVTPAGQARTDYGAVALTLTVFRAPAFPAGVDVLSARVEPRDGKETTVRLKVSLPENVRIGTRAAHIGGRSVLLLPQTARSAQSMRDWGYADDAASLPGWAHPASACDPAFANIRAGLGGVPISYRFKVEPGATRKVFLGFCESHWAVAGSRPVVCQVEGALAKNIDPLAAWGRHIPGAVEFQAKDANNDGMLEISVLPAPGAPDLNPILNVIWIFKPDEPVEVPALLAGEANSRVLRYVDVGGKDDQSLFAGGDIEYDLTVPAGGRQLDFIAAPPQSSAPLPGETAWTSEKLRRAALEVWRDWR